MTHKNILVEEVARGLSNPTYSSDLQATKELMELSPSPAEIKWHSTTISSEPIKT